MNDLISALPFACIMINQEEFVIAANEKALELLGKNIVNNHFIKTLRHPEIVSAIEQVSELGVVRQIRWSTSRDNLSLVFNVHIAKVDKHHILITFEDKTQAEQSHQIRRDFVTNVGHELKTPLTSILGFLETLQTVAKNDPLAHERFIILMREEAERMNRLVSGLLSLNHVEYNERTRPDKEIDICELINATIENLYSLAQKTNNQIKLDLPSNPIAIKGDADQLQQVLTNLIENAIKYSDTEKPITVSLSDVAYQTPLRRNGVRLCVIDQGTGIATGHLSRLTERFYRVDSHRSRVVGGTGLGLSIVKHIVNRHRGRMKINSILGEGSTFSIFLPCE